MKKTLITLAALMLIALPILAQEQTGRIEGKVTTEDGIAIPNAKVTVTSASLMGQRETVTNERGSFRFQQLPIGEYKINVTAEQYQSFEQSGLGLSIGATITLNPVLRAGGFEEVITITGESPIIDVKRTDVGETLTNELISMLPTPRFPSDLFAMTPGNIGGDTVTLGGGTRSNAYLLDGIDVSDPQTATVWVFVNMESIDEMEILPVAGTSAEVGGFTGAAMNMVSKSGGNSFSGGAVWYYFDDSFLNRNTDDDYLYDNTLRESKNDEKTAFVGGPIIKDRIWFYGNVGLRKRARVYGEDLDAPLTYEYRNSMWKASAMLTNSIMLNGTYHYDNYLRERRGGGWNVADEATLDQEGPNNSFAMDLVWTISDNDLLELKFHGWDGYFALLNRGEGAQYYDVNDDYYYHGSGYDYRSDRQRMQLVAKYSKFLDQFYGQHDMKLGFEWQRGKAVENDEWDYIEIWDGVFDYRETYFDYYYEAFTIQPTFYFNDSWSVTDRLLINAGLRYEIQTMHSPDFTTPGGDQIRGNGDIHTFHNWAPRLGFTYKVDKEGKFLVRGSVGRYYETLVTGILDRFCPNPSIWTEYYWDDGWVPYYTEPMGADTSVYTIADDLGQAYTNAFTVGTEYELSKGLVLGVDYLYREGKDYVVLWEDGITWTPVTVNYAGKTFNMFSMGDEDPHFTIRNGADDLYANYKALILRLTKRYSDNWQLQASVTISELYGSAAQRGGGTEGQTSGGLDYYEDPNNQINREGLMGGHRPILVKVNGTYTFPYDISISGIANYYSGRRWSPIGRVSDPLLAQGRVYLLTEPRGSRTSGGQFTLDIRGEKTFQFGRYGLRLFADAYNLFNSASVTSVQENFYSSSFGEPIDVVPGRYFQLGFKFTF